MKKLLLSAAGMLLYFMPSLVQAQTYSAWGSAVNQHNNMYDTLSTAGDSLKFRFPSTPATAWSSARLVVYYEGNFGNYYDNMEAFDETLNNFGSTNSSSFGYDCSPEDSTVFTITAADINIWNANNSIMFTFIPNSGPGACTTSRVRAHLVYNYCLSGLPFQYATPSISNALVCSSDAPYTLTGVPAGGTFSGPGVTGSSFDPANLAPGNYTIRYTATDSHTCTTTGSLTVFVGSKPVVNGNAAIYACNGSTVNLNASQGTDFVWFPNASLTSPLDTTAVFTTPGLTQTTNYWVAAINQNNKLRIDTVKNSNFAIVDEESLAGDDRGGIAVTKRHVYLNGDDNAVRYDLNLTPSSGVPLPIRDGMFSDLRTGKLWSMWNSTLQQEPVNSPSQFDVNALRGLDSNLNFTNEYIYLSQTIDMGTDNEQNGVFAGFGHVGFYSGDTQHWYVIDMDNGQVSDLGFLNSPELSGSENWSDWGVLESSCTGAYSVIYRDNNDDNIHRRVIPNGAVTSVGTFTNGISDMASLTFNPWNNRWYWHYEGSATTFGGNNETLGYADAVGSNSVCSGSGLGCVTKVTVNVPVNVTLSVASGTTCVSNAAMPLTGGAPAGGTYSGIGVGTNTAGTVFYPALAGNGTYTITYTYTDAASHCTDAASVPVTVNLCTGIEEHTTISGLSIFPNPNAGSFYFKVSEEVSSLLIEVTDVQGRVVFTQSQLSVQAGAAQAINLMNVEDGMYFVKLTSGTQQHIQRISVIH